MSATRRIILSTWIILATSAALQAQLTVYSAVQLLDSVFQQQQSPALRYTGDEDADFRIAFIEDVSGKGAGVSASAQALGSLRTGAGPTAFPILLSGRYEVSNPLQQEGLELVFGSMSFQLPAEDPLILENTAFWLRFYPQRRPQEARELIKEEAIVILSLLSVSAGLANERNIPLGAQQWQAISRELEDNPFIRNQLGSLRFSMLPATHPLMPAITERLNQYAVRFASQLAPPMNAAAQRPAPALAYFSLPDIEKNYREPVIANAALELRAAGDRIQTRRTSESGGLNATAIAAGLTDFVIERAKEEFSVTFLERMQDNLAPGERSKFEELRLLFPQTCTFFTTQIDLARYKSMLPMAREAFIADLRSLGLNIHHLLELQPYQELQNSGEVFNLALFYDIASMAYQGIALDTLLNNVFVRLDRRDELLFRQGNKELADQAIARKVDLTSLRQEVGALSRELDDISERILRKNVQLEAQAFPRLQLAAETAKALPAYQNLYQAYLQEAASRDQRLLLWLGKDRHEQLRNIPLNLEGRRYYEQWLRYPRLDQYPQYFSSAPDSVQLIASGLELSKKLVNPMPGTTDLPSFVIDYFQYLTFVEQEVAAMTRTLQAASPQAIRQRADSLDSARKTLESDLIAEIQFWEQKKLPALEDDIAALKFLQKALHPDNDPAWNIPRNQSPEQIQQAIQENSRRMQQAMQWVAARLEALASRSGAASPLLSKIKAALAPPPEVPAAVSADEERLEKIRSSARNIRQMLQDIDQQRIGKLYKAREETLLMENVVEMASRLMSCLRVGYQSAKGNVYLSPGSFRDLLAKDRSRDLFLGITQQQLQQVSAQSRLSAKSVAAITTKFVDIVYQAGQQRDSLRNIRDRKPQFGDYFPIVRMGMDMLSTLIDNPLTEGGKPLFEKLVKVPRITDQTLSMFEHVQSGRYGFAIYNLVELFRLVSEGSDIANQRWRLLREDLLLYGSFMANVATAQTAEDMKAALLAVALPPGSSRVKRQEPFNLALNAYLGLSGGRESLDAAAAIRKDAFTLGLSMPIGLATSWKFQPHHATSYSIVLSVLDLGAIAAFRLGDANAGLLPELTFDNFVAPGAFFLANLPRSPFSVGFGSQYGPRARKITPLNGVETRSSAWRWLLFAGIDVPVFNFATQRKR